MAYLFMSTLKFKLTIIPIECEGSIHLFTNQNPYGNLSSHLKSICMLELLSKLT